MIKLLHPALVPAAQIGTAPAPLAERPSGAEAKTILLVDDDPESRARLSGAIEDQGYRVLAADSSAQAEALWQEHGGRVDLLLTDMALLNGLTGLELAEKLTARCPSLKVVYTIGFGMDELPANFAVRRGHQLVRKSCQPHTLAGILRRCLGFELTQQAA